MRALLLLLIGFALGACGYKAPLYLAKPRAEAAKPPTVVTPEAAPDRPTPGQSAPAPK